jgi:hypothetical protein
MCVPSYVDMLVLLGVDDRLGATTPAVAAEGAASVSG